MSQCVNVNYTLFSTGTTNVNGVSLVRNALLDQYDDILANKSGPGLWSLKNGNRLVESSRIRPTEVVNDCPMLNAGGSILLLKNARVVTDGVERELRVRVRIRDADGIIGVVFGFQNITSYYRVLLREIDNCFVAQQRTAFNVTTAIVETNRVPSIITTRPIELRVRWGNNLVSARLWDPEALVFLSPLLKPTAFALPDASVLGGDVGLWSSNTDGANFETLVMYDASRLAMIVEPTFAPTPAPTPRPTPLPTPVKTLIFDAVCIEIST